MLNILLPMAGNNRFESDEYYYPKPLIEIAGIPMIEHVVRSLDGIDQEKQFIFVVNSSDCQAYHLDSVLQLITNKQCKIIRLNKMTKGAACTALMAIEMIDNDDPLIISNSDHIIDYNLNEVLSRFTERDVDAGTITFESIHPKWSFVRLDENGKIIETAEKHPLSKKAIAGFYYFRRGSDFTKAAMKMIEKDANFAGMYYLAPAMNELVLENKNLETFDVPADRYFNFYDSHKVKTYENYLIQKNMVRI